MAKPKMDDKQKKLHQLCSEYSFLNNSSNTERVLLWNTFFRRNLDRFVEMYLQISLYWYQSIILYLMSKCYIFVFVAARAAAKSFMIALYAVCQAILRPGVSIVIVSGTKGQANIIIRDKIEVELMNISPMLRKEIAEISSKGEKLYVRFNNNSYIRIVPATEYARGGRCNIVIYEEFRLIKKSVIDNIIAPFLVSRQPPYLFDRDMYGGIQDDLMEEPVSIYISSAWLKSHWMWNTMQSSLYAMLNGENEILIGLDYAITMMHRIKTKRYLIDQRNKVDNTTWAIEYENRMISDNTHTFFKYSLILPRQTIKRAWYPRTIFDYIAKVKNKYDIPKQEGEIRVISCDIAMISDDANDNSVYSCLRLLPEQIDKNTNQIGYRVQIPYLEHRRGGETTGQAIRIKQLYTDFNADYVVLDVRNAGISVLDALGRILYDDERDCEYPAWTCMNDDSLSSRIVTPNAMPIVYCFTGYQRLNSEIAITLRSMMESKKVDFLVQMQDGIDEIKSKIPEYVKNEDPVIQNFYEQPYLETEALVHEMVDLEYEVTENTGAVRVKEPRSGMKDRYISVAMGCHFSSKLALDLLNTSTNDDYASFSGCVSDVSFD